MNLLVEYRKRHKAKFIMPTNDGLCFFNDHKRPALIALTSTMPKSFSHCSKCGTNDSWITLELFIPSRDDVFSCIIHNHIHPDADLTGIIQSTFSFDNFEPVMLKHGIEIETWLWNFFLFHSRLRRSRSWTETCKSTATKDPLKSYEQMTQCAIHFPKIFKSYYNMYQAFVSGRKYLIFE